MLLGHHGSQCPLQPGLLAGHPSWINIYILARVLLRCSPISGGGGGERGKGREGKGGEGEGRGGREEVQVQEGLFVDCFHFRCTVDIWWTFYEVLIELSEKRRGTIKKKRKKKEKRQH